MCCGAKVVLLVILLFSLHTRASWDRYDGWRDDEYKAFQEAVAYFGWRYEYVAWSLASKQVAVKITGTGARVT